MLEKNKNLVAGAFIFVFAIIFYILSFNIQLTNIDTLVGSRFFPQAVTILMMICSALLIIESLVKNKRNKESGKTDMTNQETEVEEGQKPNYKNTILVFTSLGIYVILLDKIGFMISTVIYLASQMFILESKEKRNPVKYIIISIITTIVVYYAFTKGFSLMLPRGSVF